MKCPYCGSTHVEAHGMMDGDIIRMVVPSKEPQLELEGQISLDGEL